MQSFRQYIVVKNLLDAPVSKLPSFRAVWTKAGFFHKQYNERADNTSLELFIQTFLLFSSYLFHLPKAFPAFEGVSVDLSAAALCNMCS